MEKNDARNTLIFALAAMALLLVYDVFVLGPIQKRKELELAQQKAAALSVVTHPVASLSVPTRGQILAKSARIDLRSSNLTGSLSLKGARIDDLFLNQYRVSLKKDAPKVELFRPEGVPQAYYAAFGWVGTSQNLPTDITLWTKLRGDVLTPGHPIVLGYDNGQGLVFTRTVSLDDRFMFTVTDEVKNLSNRSVGLASYGSVQHQGMPVLTPNILVHEGGVAALGDKHELRIQAFKDWKNKGDTLISSRGGWVGLTDKYWLAAVIPDQTEPAKAGFRFSYVDGTDVYEANFLGTLHNLSAGQSMVISHHLFAGAKRVSFLQAYQKDLNIPNFDNAVDWGNLWFITRPVFWLLSYFQSLTGNWGVAILLMTLVVKLALFPLAQKGFHSAASMKKLQPQMDELRKKFEKDPVKLQQETMALYQKEKVNPFAGCLPILIQIPILYALSKVLWVAAEMRQAPFFGWITDLSAPDPTSFVNLFGLIPWHPETAPIIGSFLAGVFHIGIWPLLYGVTQWLSTSMTPPATQDPSQKIIYQLMPVVFTIMMAGTPSGLLIYWAWSGTLTVLQQYVIMHHAGVENPIDNVFIKAAGLIQGRLGIELPKNPV